MAREWLTQKGKPDHQQNLQLADVTVPELNDTELAQVSRLVFPSDSDDRTETVIKPGSAEEEKLADYLVERNAQIVKDARDAASEDQFVEEQVQNIQLQIATEKQRRKHEQEKAEKEAEEKKEAEKRKKAKEEAEKRKRHNYLDDLDVQTDFEVNDTYGFFARN